LLLDNAIVNCVKKLLCDQVNTFLQNVELLECLGLAEEFPLVVFVFPDIRLLLEDHHEDFAALKMAVLAN